MAGSDNLDPIGGIIEERHMSLATKYRPKTFEDVCGQNITVTILKKVLETGSFKNCYIFAGKSGTGKTTCARIFAKAINKGRGEPIEIDAASNNGVDNVRALLDEADQRAIDGEYKIVILDEAHGLTPQAWQAFLKGLEECPKYTIFIFCTTEPQKLPATILNRMQRYNFAPIPAGDIKQRLMQICEAEGFENYEDTCDFLSKLADGGMRNAIGYLEQCSDYSHDLSLENAKKVLGGLSYETAFRLTWALKEGNVRGVLGIVDSMYAEGQDLKHFMDWYLSFALDLEKYALFRSIEATDIPAYLAAEGNEVVQYTVKDEDSLQFLGKLVEEVLKIRQAIKNDLSYKATISAMLTRFARNG